MYKQRYIKYPDLYLYLYPVWLHPAAKQVTAAKLKIKHVDSELVKFCKDQLTVDAFFIIGAQRSAESTA